MSHHQWLGHGCLLDARGGRCRVQGRGDRKCRLTLELRDGGIGIALPPPGGLSPQLVIGGEE